MKIEIINTSRLSIRGFEATDAAFAMSIWNDPEMGEYLPDPSIENMNEPYRKSLETLGNDEDCCYLISVSKITGERIGTCSFIPSKDGTVYDIAYCVHKKHWNLGYATEMANGMIQYAQKHGAKKITIDINKENAASNAIAQKLGFVVVSEKSYQKRGTTLTFIDYRYEFIITH
jgi:[ribosomal protein S5]-alanine N-acetyltransferase